MAAAMIWVAVRALPAASRDRYRDELRAELCCLRRRGQISEAASALAGSLALRHAIQEDDMTPGLSSNKYFACRIGRHRYELVSGDNAENRADRHLQCKHCAAIKEVAMYEPSDGKYLGGNSGLT
jgi:hypothetical protein